MLVDSLAWQERFEDWIEDGLVREQLDEAARAIVPFDHDNVLRVLDEMVADRIGSEKESVLLPTDTLPSLATRDMGAKVLRGAGHLITKGQHDEAIAYLESEEVQGDSDALYLRTQLLDQAERDGHPSDRLTVISEYEAALRHDRKGAHADHARLRIGQIYLGLRFFDEARINFEKALRADLAQPYRDFALISYAESTYHDKDNAKTLETLESLDPNQFSGELSVWYYRRTGDTYFRLHRFTEAVEAYYKLLDLKSGPVTTYPLVALRIATSLLAIGESEEADSYLKPIFKQDPPQEYSAIAGLLVSHSLRAKQSYPEAAIVAAKVIDMTSDLHESALATVQMLEADRLGGDNQRGPLPRSILTLATRTPSDPVSGLLAYRVAIHRDILGPEVIRQRLGNLMALMPDGPVRELVHDDLGSRLEVILRDIYLGVVPLDEMVLSETQRYLRPHSLDENGILLAIDGFSKAGMREACIQWGNALGDRDVRPIRRGAGIWRAIQCRNIRSEDLTTADNLIDIADNGEVGAFSMAITTVAAELMVRIGRVLRATRAYERALQSFAQRDIAAPSLIRLGELQIKSGKIKLGMQRVSRGLALMDSESDAQNSFRKMGIIALAQGAATANDTKRLASLLKQDRRYIDDWWKPAYGYIGYRLGVGVAPTGDDIFSEAATAMREVDRLERRVNKLKNPEGKPTPKPAPAQATEQ